jgi:hypothetical protein
MINQPGRRRASRYTHLLIGTSRSAENWFREHPQINRQFVFLAWRYEQLLGIDGQGVEVVYLYDAYTFRDITAIRNQIARTMNQPNL